MKHNITTIVRSLARRVAALVAVVACLAFVASAVGCSEKEDPASNINYTEGVVMPQKTSFERNMQSASLGLSFTTESGYKLDVDNAEMIILKTGMESSTGGLHTVEFDLTANESTEPRTGAIYITVTGHNRMKLYEFKQSGAAAVSEVTRWVDERLRNEYYWLDEYNEKRGTFDLSLAYDKYLSTSLMSLTTNTGDGGYLSNGSRYLYSNIKKESSTRAAMAAEEEPTVSSFGMVISSLLVGIDQKGTLAFCVDHVYPSSPAAEAGIKRGDMIYKVNGKSTTDMTEANQIFHDLQYGTGTMELTLKTADLEKGEYVDATYSLTSADYKENPVAYCDILPIDENVNPNGKKVGYISYLSFDGDFNKSLVDSISSLAQKGATDVVLDLRINSGGAVTTALYLSSMLLDESYAGKYFAMLKHNPKNTRFEDERRKLVKSYTDPNTLSTSDLPNLDIDKLWVIVSEFSASASELVISGMLGIDVPVFMVGIQTEGKNYGMDVITRTIDGDTYVYAPITFLVENAKGFSDYDDGFEPDVNLAKYIDDESVAENLRDLCYLYPSPRAEWGEYKRDIALAEMVKQICQGTSLFASSSASSFVEPSLTTRSQGAPMLRKGARLNLPANDLRRQGMYITEAEVERIAKDNIE